MSEILPVSSLRWFALDSFWICSPPQSPGEHYMWVSISYKHTYWYIWNTIGLDCLSEPWIWKPLSVSALQAGITKQAMAMLCHFPDPQGHSAYVKGGAKSPWKSPEGSEKSEVSKACFYKRKKGANNSVWSRNMHPEVDLFSILMNILFKLV